ncbi:conserved hypothetical protein [Coccidioides posadasii str. Silveira]|uniref:Uncharacterized protein n=2 Tax=Coccidioides posadasii TaxID=199306 RepID=E9D196_COCPS|nr:conserved hypothetical protein [Coccidioides posadasii str. Silveira]KMM72028.1 hypothetical protein CPAG_08327 [Coccidioides posadasii RMSCC 3488]
MSGAFTELRDMLGSQATLALLFGKISRSNYRPIRDAQAMARKVQHRLRGLRDTPEEKHCLTASMPLWETIGRALLGDHMNSFNSLMLLWGFGDTYRDGVTANHEHIYVFPKEEM